MFTVEDPQTWDTGEALPAVAPLIATLLGHVSMLSKRSTRFVVVSSFLRFLGAVLPFLPQPAGTPCYETAVNFGFFFSF